jgi:vitamin B12/bleomycin/antimicrobial peptide transport system ATP-binding/permease protein
VSYPAEPGRFDDAAVGEALERVDLGHLTPSLDRTERWDRQLTLDEQQRLAFARLLLHKPRWVVLDDAISALGDEHRRLVLSLAKRELAEATLIGLGRDAVLDGFWTRTLHIVEVPGGPCLHIGLPPAAQAADVGRIAAGSSAAASPAASSAPNNERLAARRKGWR